MNRTMSLQDDGRQTKRNSKSRGKEGGGWKWDGGGGGTVLYTLYAQHMFATSESRLAIRERMLEGCVAYTAEVLVLSRLSSS